LDDAADRIEQRGWVQGHTSSDEGLCLIYALGEATRVNAPSKWRTVSDSLQRIVGLDLVDWNDAPGRTKQQVLDAFRAAAKQERMHPETPAQPRPVESTT
jgi:hypothetical protein